MKKLILAVFAFLLPYSAWAQQVTFEVTLNSGHTITDENGSISKEESESVQNMAFIVDVESKKAFLHGNDGTIPVLFFASDDKIVFFQSSDIGHAQMFSMTSIDATTRKVVQSKHFYTKKANLYSLFYGEAEVK